MSLLSKPSLSYRDVQLLLRWNSARTVRLQSLRGRVFLPSQTICDPSLQSYCAQQATCLSTTVTDMPLSSSRQRLNLKTTLFEIKVLFEAAIKCEPLCVCVAILFFLNVCVCQCLERRELGKVREFIAPDEKTPLEILSWFGWRQSGAQMT